MLHTDILGWLLIASSIVHAAHFRGGYLSWEVVSPYTTNDTMITINIQQTYSWTYARYPCGVTVGDTGSLTCISSNCSNYLSSMTQISAPCINYDINLDLSTGQSITPVTLLVGSQLVLRYQGSQWLPLVQTTSLLYGLSTYIHLTVRSDNGRINSSPTASMFPLVTVLVSVQQALRIPMGDVDLDIVKCRWANSTGLMGNTIVDECLGICKNIPGAQLYTSSNTDNICNIVFTTAIAGDYVVALQIEDFMPTAPNGSALSSIPLQFLVRTMNISCNQPNITGQLAADVTVQVEANTTFSVSIMAQAGCNTTSINRFLTIVLPSGSANTTAMTSLGSLVYSIKFIWTPNIDQIGSTQLFCTVAIDDNNLQSRQYCLNLKVISATTTSTTTSSTGPSGTLIISTSANTLPANNQSTNLGLILGLGIPLLLLLGILASFIACRWHPGQFWQNLRRRFWDDQNISPQQHQSQHSNRLSRNSKQIAIEESKQYRQQYINDKSPTTTTTKLSYINSFSSDPGSPFDNNSVLTMRTFLSSSSTNVLPDVETPTNRFQSLHLSQGGSILMQAFHQQEEQYI